MPRSRQNYARSKFTAMIVTAVIVAGGVTYIDKLKSENSDTTTSLTQNSTSTTPVATDGSSATSISSESTDLRDGTYNATSEYYVPHSQEFIQVNVTLKNDVVADVSIQNSEGDRESAKFQQDFTSTYKSHVVGKKISDLRLSVISGASDTTQGFNDALSKIVVQAQG